MSAKTTISWTDYTWNPVSGCTRVSAGCDNCYADAVATRFAGTDAYPAGFQVTLKPERLEDPLKKASWRGKKVFVNSMSDLFHADVPDDYIARVFAVMALCPDTAFQILTKRHGRMRSLLSLSEFQDDVLNAVCWYGNPSKVPHLPWPLPNVWLGVTVEDQKAADLRIPALLGTPAAIRFLSCEPLIGPVDLATPAGLDLVIAGGESGPGARPLDPAWARSLRETCATAQVPFYVKQMGSVWARANGLRGKAESLDDIPEDLRIRQKPGSAAGTCIS